MTSTGPQSRNKALISLHGIIGCGKSSVLERIQQNNDGEIKIVPKDLDAWTNFGGRYNMLELIYSDPKEHAFSTQIYILGSKFDRYMKALEDLNTRDVCIERGITTDTNIFVSKLLSEKSLTSLQASVVLDLSETLGRHIKPDLCLYIRTPVHACLRRIKHRARSEESKVTELDLTELQSLHDAAFSRVLDACGEPIFNTVIYNDVVNEYVACIDGAPSIQHVYKAVMDGIEQYKAKKKMAPLKR
jgi:deoxyadenosine/deoxycytidine kinase